MESLDHTRASFETPSSVATSVYSRDGADLLDDANTVTYRDARSHTHRLVSNVISTGAAGYDDAHADIDSDHGNATTDAEMWSDVGQSLYEDTPRWKCSPRELNSSVRRRRGADDDSRGSRTPSLWSSAKEYQVRSSQGNKVQVDAPCADDEGDDARAPECGGKHSIPLSSEAHSSASRALDGAFTEVVVSADALEEEGYEGDEWSTWAGAPPPPRPSRSSASQSHTLMEGIRAVSHDGPDQMSATSYALLEEARACRGGWYLNLEESTDTSYLGARWPYRLRSIPSTSVTSSRASTVCVPLGDACAAEPLLAASPLPRHPAGEARGRSSALNSRDHSGSMEAVCHRSSESVPPEDSDGTFASQRRHMATRRSLISPSVTDEDGEELSCTIKEARGSAPSAATGASVSSTVTRSVTPPSSAYELVQGRGRSPAASTVHAARAQDRSLQRSEDTREWGAIRDFTAPQVEAPRQQGKPSRDAAPRHPLPTNSDTGESATELFSYANSAAYVHRMTPPIFQRTNRPRQGSPHIRAASQQVDGEHCAEWEGDQLGGSPAKLNSSPTNYGSTEALLTEDAYVEEELLDSQERLSGRLRAPTSRTENPPLLTHESVVASTIHSQACQRDTHMERGRLYQQDRFATREAQMRRAWLTECELKDRVDRSYVGVTGSLAPFSVSHTDAQVAGDYVDGQTSIGARSAVASSLLPNVLNTLASLLRTAAGESGAGAYNDDSDIAAGRLARTVHPLSDRDGLRGLFTTDTKMRVGECERGSRRLHLPPRQYPALSGLMDSLIHSRTNSLPSCCRHHPTNAREAVVSSVLEDEAMSRARLALAFNICRMVAPHSRELLLLLMLMVEEEEDQQSRRSGHCGSRAPAGTVTLAMCAEATNRVLEKYGATRRERAAERLCAHVLLLAGHRLRRRKSGDYGRVEYATFVSSVLEVSHLRSESRTHSRGRTLSAAG